MTSILGPVTDADLRRWQMRRYELLGGILTVGAEQGLTWLVSEHALVGQAHYSDHGERRSAIEAWAAALDLERADDHVYASGTSMRVRASTKDLWGRGGSVTVMADVVEKEPGDG